MSHWTDESKECALLRHLGARVANVNVDCARHTVYSLKRDGGDARLVGVDGHMAKLAAVEITWPDGDVSVVVLGPGYSVRFAADEVSS